RWISPFLNISPHVPDASDARVVHKPHISLRNGGGGHPDRHSPRAKNEGADRTVQLAVVPEGHSVRTGAQAATSRSPADGASLSVLLARALTRQLIPDDKIPLVRAAENE